MNSRRISAEFTNPAPGQTALYKLLYNRYRLLDWAVAALMVYAGFSGLSREGRGKSELHRAMCQVTPGRPGSSPVDGKCHRENTAIGQTVVRVKRCGKSAPAGQQCTAHGKPHTEQDQIGEKLRPSGFMRAGSVRGTSG